MSSRSCVIVNTEIASSAHPAITKSKELGTNPYGIGCTHHPTVTRPRDMDSHATLHEIPLQSRPIGDVRISGLEDFRICEF